MTRFWLLMMDVTNAIFGFGSRAHLWAVRKAGATVEYPEPSAEEYEEGGEW